MPILLSPATMLTSVPSVSRKATAAKVELARGRPVASTAALPLPPSTDPRLGFVRCLVWLYIILWVTEGALRKWILPAWANPLLIVRDPVLLGIYALAVWRKIFPFQNPFVAIIGILGALCVFVALAVTPAPPVVVIYGWRSNFLHAPLIFLFPLLFDERDVRAVGRWFLISAIPMSLLVLAQFRSPATAWVNTVAGGEGKQLESALDHVRVAGTFSFTNGMCAYTALVTAFFCFQMLERKAFPRWLWFFSGGALIILVALSGSRATVGIVGVVVLGVVLTCVLRPAYWRASFKLFAVGGIALLALGSFAVFREGLNVFSYRFGDEESVHKGFFLRYASSFLVAPVVWDIAPSGGVGLGMGTNVASSLLMGKRFFMTAEGEYDRLVLESGPILGSLCIMLRQAVVVWLGVQAIRRLRAESRPLPLLLLCSGVTSLLIGQWAQPTELGFSIIAGGLCLAATRRAPELFPAVSVNDSAAGRPKAAATLAGSSHRDAIAGRPKPNAVAPKIEVSPPSRPPAAAPPPRQTPLVRRGRSAYAERLHGRNDGATQQPR